MKYYLTSAIPYVNAQPHVGHALEFVQSDVLKRAKQLQGFDVVYACGSDENALKNVQAAEKEGVPVEQFCATHAVEFQHLAEQLEVNIDAFIRSSSSTHHASSQELWKRCAATAGDIYKKAYTGLYCVGCETFYSKDELNEQGECFEHPGKPLVEVEEENYFFKLSKYKQQLLDLIQSDQVKIVPETRKNEVLGFLKGDVQDISISRSKERAKGWGVPVPNDETQMMYVWFDALNVYQSVIGFGSDQKKYDKYWPADAHVIGKGIVRFHAVYWIAMLLSAKLALPKTLYVHGYFTVNGQKMSKTLGNVIDPHLVIKQYGAEALRYYFLREFSPILDGDFSTQRLHEVYHAHLSNGLGNLCSRVAKLCEQSNFSQTATSTPTIRPEIFQSLERFELKIAFDLVWDRIDALNKKLSDEKPWEIDPAARLSQLQYYMQEIRGIAAELQPFLPATAQKILAHYSAPKVVALSPLFPRVTV